MHSSVYAAVFALFGAAAYTSDGPESQNVNFEDANGECFIQVEESYNMLHLSAYSAEGIGGEYVLSLQQSGPGGSGQITQSGFIEEEQYGPTLLSEISLNSGTSYSAELQVYGTDGNYACRSAG